ncbi:hypothetical protein K1T71_014317 [Dendrolimus kikuchii]|uniref:Uncharacterized protein n=1 Tax=Dendrolimus kikuchii TaxID=765133 RepID=A0ACC1CFQ0_9NEOP|nr:hypothetical protein K1T71_014317 [Dendrolimus kikuchii]
MVAQVAAAATLRPRAAPTTTTPPTATHLGTEANALRSNSDMRTREEAPGWKRGGLTLALPLLLLLLVCSAHALSIPDKRSETIPMVPTAKVRLCLKSRFFMGGRYGKRSEPPSPVAPPRGGGALFCRYTGVYPLYRCLPRIKQDHFDKRYVQVVLANVEICKQTST